MSIACSVRETTRPPMARPPSLRAQLTYAAAILWCAMAGNAHAASADEVFRKVQGQILEVEVVEKGQVSDSFSGIVVERGKVVVPCDNLNAQGSTRIRSGGSPREASVTHRDVLRNLC